MHLLLVSSVPKAQIIAYVLDGVMQGGPQQHHLHGRVPGGVSDADPRLDAFHAAGMGGGEGLGPGGLPPRDAGEAKGQRVAVGLQQLVSGQYRQGGRNVAGDLHGVLVAHAVGEEEGFRHRSVAQQFSEELGGAVREGRVRGGIYNTHDASME